MRAVPESVINCIACTVFEAHRTGRREAYTYLKEFVLEKLEVPDWPLDPMPKLPANDAASIAPRIIMNFPYECVPEIAWMRAAWGLGAGQGASEAPVSVRILVERATRIMLFPGQHTSLLSFAKSFVLQFIEKEIPNPQTRAHRISEIARKPLRDGIRNYGQPKVLDYPLPDGSKDSG